MQWRRMVAVRLENARFERSEDGGSACGSTTMSVLWLGTTVSDLG
jgi:hypothetical protein